MAARSTCVRPELHQAHAPSAAPRLWSSKPTPLLDDQLRRLLRRQRVLSACATEWRLPVAPAEKLTWRKRTQPVPPFAVAVNGL